MDRSQKEKLVASLKKNLTSSAFVAVVYYRGMTDKELYDMRVQLKSKECSIKIAKNTLVKIAVKDTELEKLTPHLTGPCAILYSQDVVALSKIIHDFSKQVKALEIVTAHFNNELIDESAITNMAKLGSLDDVRASFIGILKGAQSNFVRILNAPEQGLAELKKE
ncbi:MAG: 50S ribosomal protein L10 [Rickettsiales bacterium]|nr:50S ribosomal protein L10 [Rickettsiales bacterium]